MIKNIPDSLQDHILPFNWDVSRVWGLNACTERIERTQLDYLLKLPLWSSVPGKGMLFDISPLEVILDSAKYPHQTSRVQKAATFYPIDLLVFNRKIWILDGVHRIAKLYVMKQSELSARYHSPNCIPNIVKANNILLPTQRARG